MSCSLSPVSVAIFGVLNVASLLALAPGGVWDVTPQGTTYPSVMFELQESQQLGGFGTYPGNRAVTELELRVHVFSQYAGMKEAETVMAEVMRLLAPASLTIVGYTHIGKMFHQDTIPLPDELVAGVRVNELVSRWILQVEEA